MPFEERVTLDEQALPAEVPLQGESVGVAFPIEGATLDEELFALLKAHHAVTG